jgi:phage shock protein E
MRVPLHLPVALLLSAVALAASARSFSYQGTCQDAVIDVRTSQEYASGHIQGAINIPLAQLGSGIKDIPGLHKDSRILLYCVSGRRSAQAAALLKTQGYRHISDAGRHDTLEARLATCARR